MFDFLLLILLTTLGSASPYYFGTTNLACMISGKRKRRAPSRGVLEYTHRFIYYQGYYFEFSNRGKYKHCLRLKNCYTCGERLVHYPIVYKSQKMLAFTILVIHKIISKISLNLCCFLFFKIFFIYIYIRDMWFVCIIM